MAERMVSRELQDINNSGKIKNGILNPNDLEENSRFMLDRYMDYKVRSKVPFRLSVVNVIVLCSESTHYAYPQ